MALPGSDPHAPLTLATRNPMEHTTHTTDALEADILQLLAQGAAELDALDRQQQVIARALD